MSSSAKPTDLESSTSMGIGRRVGGGWEIASVVQVQQKEKQKVERRREQSRRIAAFNAAQAELERQHGAVVAPEELSKAEKLKLELEEFMQKEDEEADQRRSRQMSMLGEKKRRKGEDDKYDLGGEEKAPESQRGVHRSGVGSASGGGRGVRFVPTMAFGADSNKSRSSPTVPQQNWKPPTPSSGLKRRQLLNRERATTPNDAVATTVLSGLLTTRTEFNARIMMSQSGGWMGSLAPSPTNISRKGTALISFHEGSEKLSVIGSPQQRGGDSRPGSGSQEGSEAEGKEGTNENIPPTTGEEKMRRRLILSPELLADPEQFYFFLEDFVPIQSKKGISSGAANTPSAAPQQESFIEGSSSVMKLSRSGTMTSMLMTPTHRGGGSSSVATAANQSTGSPYSSTASPTLPRASVASTSRGSVSASPTAGGGGRGGSPASAPAHEEDSSIDIGEHLYFVGKETSIGVGGARALSVLLKLPCAHSIFSIVFSFVYCAFYRPIHLPKLDQCTKDDLPKLMAEFVLENADIEGGSAAGDVFPFILAQATGKLLVKIADPRLHTWFTERMWDRIHALVLLLLNGKYSTAYYIRHMRDTLFPPLLGRRESVKGGVNLRRALRKKSSAAPAKLAPLKNYQKSLMKALDGREGRIGSGKKTTGGAVNDTLAELRRRRLEAQDITVPPIDPSEFPAVKDQDNDFSVFNTHILEDVDNARDLVRLRRREWAETQKSAFDDASATTATAMLESLEQEGERDTDKLRAEKFLRMSAPSGQRKNPFESDVQYSEEDLKAWPVDLVLLGLSDGIDHIDVGRYSPRCHPLAERLILSKAAAGDDEDFDEDDGGPLLLEQQQQQSHGSGVVSPRSPLGKLPPPPAMNPTVLENLSIVSAFSHLGDGPRSPQGQGQGAPTTTTSPKQQLQVPSNAATRRRSSIASSAYSLPATARPSQLMQPALSGSKLANSKKTLQQQAIVSAGAEDGSVVDGAAPPAATHHQSKRVPLQLQPERNIFDVAALHDGLYRSHTPGESLDESLQGIRHFHGAESQLPSMLSTKRPPSRTDVKKTSSSVADEELTTSGGGTGVFQPPLLLPQQTDIFSSSCEDVVSNGPGSEEQVGDDKNWQEGAAQVNARAIDTLAQHLQLETKTTRRQPTPLGGQKPPLAITAAGEKGTPLPLGVQAKRAKTPAGVVSSTGAGSAVVGRLGRTSISSSQFIPRSSTPGGPAGAAGSPDRRRATTGELKEAVGGGLQQRTRLMGMSPLMRGVVHTPAHTRVSPALTTTHAVPRTKGAVRDMKVILVTQDRMETKYREKRQAEAAAFSRDLAAQGNAAKQEMLELDEIANDPLKRAEFTYQLVKEGIKKAPPDPVRHPEYYQGSFLAEVAKDTSRQTKAIFRKVETTLAALRRRRKK